jgi:prepilin-type N-terminal cleavage/methylation domain-containing protein
MTFRRRNRQSAEKAVPVRRRSAFTLIEILLVLAILVIVAAASAPALNGVMRQYRLQSAADAVRADLTRAHVLAMKSGRVQIFRCEIGGRKYKLEPFIAGDDAIESATGGQDSSGKVYGPGVTNPSDIVGSQGELPEGTSFVEGQAIAASRSLRIEEEAQVLQDLAWSGPILFYPDGTSSDAHVVVGNERQVGLRLDLRGMTSVVTLGEIAQLDLLKEQP